MLCAKDLLVEAKAPEPIDHGKANYDTQRPTGSAANADHIN